MIIVSKKYWKNENKCIFLTQIGFVEFLFDGGDN